MKAVLLFPFCIIIVLCATAQKGAPVFGIKAGIISANLTAKNSSYETGSKVGLTGGILLEIPLGTNWALQPEAVYLPMGGKGDVYDARIKLDYIGIPLLLKYKFNPSGFRALAGLQYAFLLSSKAYQNGVREEFDGKSSDVAGIIGAEYMFGTFGLGARYQIGFSNINKEAGGASLKNNGFSLTALLHFKK